MKSIGALLVLLAILLGYGAWNYQRNVEADAQRVRPYKSYSDADLVLLLEAYEGQAKKLSSRYERAASKRTGSSEVHLVGEGIEQFARVQERSRAIRDLGAAASQEQASVKAIEEERAYRARLGTGWQAFLQRAFVPPGS